MGCEWCEIVKYDKLTQMLSLKFQQTIISTS